jgi:hypothetical protein
VVNGVFDAFEVSDQQQPKNMDPVSDPVDRSCPRRTERGALRFDELVERVRVESILTLSYASLNPISRAARLRAC